MWLLGLAAAASLPQLHTEGSGEICLVSLHENESSGFHAGHARAKEGGVRFVAVEQAGERTVTFGELRVDPNRIFTAKGIEASAKRWTGRAPTAAEAAQVQGYAAAILDALDDCSTVVTLHNNWDAGDPPKAKDYNLLSYRSDPAAAKLHREEGADVDDFVFVTREADYERLREAGYSVVLQSPEVEDDGSLSYVLQDRRYLNIEAQHGHGAWQRRVLAEVAP